MWGTDDPQGTKAMKFTITKYKHMNIGNEGGAMTCDLYVDGKLAAHVENRGDGGQNWYRWVGAYAGTYGDIPSDIAAHVAAIPPYVDKHGPLDYDLDMAVGDAIEEFVVAKKIAAKCKKVLVFTLPTDPKNSFREMKAPYTPACAAWVMAKYPNATIHNEAVAA